MRHVQTSESAAAAASALNDDEKENEEDVATASSSTAATATGGVATVSFEMKPTNKPRKANSLRRSESGGGGVRPKEKLHGAKPPPLLNHCDILIRGDHVGPRPGLG